jgi:hypothetical protein
MTIIAGRREAACRNFSHRMENEKELINKSNRKRNSNKNPPIEEEATHKEAIVS